MPQPKAFSPLPLAGEGWEGVDSPPRRVMLRFAVIRLTERATRSISWCSPTRT
jgi:hypothetical protein